MKASEAYSVRHKKRGSTYKVLGVALLQTVESPHETSLRDGAQVVVYVGDAGLFVRPLAEFDDGRFEEVVS